MASSHPSDLIRTEKGRETNELPSDRCHWENDSLAVLGGDRGLGNSEHRGVYDRVLEQQRLGVMLAADLCFVEKVRKELQSMERMES